MRYYCEDNHGIPACSQLGGFFSSLLSAICPTEDLRVGLSISIVGNIFGLRLT